ncbi:hypothetical protein CC80DRAFT_433024 [Byssothecium circinans]|uniref:Nephrocystin 3-like N-terminal domain-containing protein n=1 Tax=Byssothecium circinans TaxID=147558 RepID=A0A6A5UF94_9PLEO|nr:hypothetical protein CC80DRAFT_433024 [Byssothecium circinans]
MLTVACSIFELLPPSMKRTAASFCGRNGHPHNRQSVRFDNKRAKIGIQAGEYHVHGDNIVQNSPDLLKQLPNAIDAAFNSYTKQHETTCLADTRIELLDEIHNWADGQDERRIFWLSGLAGTGKSTIARTVARHYFDKKHLAASFFFSRGGGDVSHAGSFVTSIAVQLAHNVTVSRPYIHDAVAERSDIASQSLRDQWRHLVLHPLSKLDEQSSYVLIVDALDECDNDNDIRIIVQLLAEAQSLERLRLRVFLTSRPEVPVRHGFGKIADTEHQDVVLHHILPSIVDHDIGIFLEYHLRHVGEEHYLDAGWPGDAVVKVLVRSASGLFIWAATACRFIDDGLFAEERLRTLVEGGDSDSTATPEEHLNEIYDTVLMASTQTSYTTQEKDKYYSILRDILGSIVTLFSPLSVGSLSRVLLLPKQKVDRMLKDLHAIIDIPKDPTRLLRLHHPSFRDFLLDQKRCRANFWVDEKQTHQKLLDSCIRLMTTSLKQDICSAGAPGMLVAHMERSQVEQSLSPELQYACLYWIQHLQKSGAQPSDNDQVHQFLQKHLLHWLEALGWLGKVPEGVHAIASLDLLLRSNQCPSLSSFIHDAKRFALYNRAAIEQAPLQTYSGLVFAPTTSLIRGTFKDCIPKCFQTLPQVEEKWSGVLQTLEGHTDEVSAVAFSPDGQTLASASRRGLLAGRPDAGVGLVGQHRQAVGH